MKRLSTFALAAILGLSGDASATSVIKLATMGDLAQAWIGTDFEVFCRLDLDKQGRGLFTMQWQTDSPALAYRVSKTSLSTSVNSAGDNLEFVLVPIGSTTQPIYLSGYALPSSIRLSIGKSSNPKRYKVVVGLHSEAWFTARLKAVTERALFERRNQK